MIAITTYITLITLRLGRPQHNWELTEKPKTFISVAPVAPPSGIPSSRLMFGQSCSHISINIC